ncbi:hypothetical protein I4U23_027237 [Adineta vaga]|nr:hypothetical protein I4U23_027237 [Adineta vaga]
MKIVSVQYSISNNDHDCFYYFENSFNNLSHHLIPYCIRHSSIHTKNQCFGNEFTFDQLRLMNITGKILWEWFAPIDLIDDYMSSYYLNQSNEQIFCNCTDSRSFGKYCQYQFISGDYRNSFDQIIREKTIQNRFDQNSLYLLDEKISSTCYISINCTTYTGICLDWREIGDGFLHCTNGIDEQYFITMELNDCDSNTEYRCRNGLCIPRNFLLDRTFDCPDWYDEPKESKWNLTNSKELCSVGLKTAECEEYRLGLNYQSCGDGQHITVLHSFETNCSNFRDILLIKSLFRPYFNQMRHDQCYLPLLCLWNILCLFESCPNGPKQRCEELMLNIQQNLCTTKLFFFPPGPFIYPYVRLAYTSRVLNGNVYPNFICWNKSICNISQNSTEQIDGFECINSQSFHFNIMFTVDKFNIYTMIRFILMIQRVFYECIDQETHINLYNCSFFRLSISPYRVNDGEYLDCYPWVIKSEEERYTVVNYQFACHLPDRFPCKGYQCITRRTIGDDDMDCFEREGESSYLKCIDEFSCQYLRELNNFQRQLIVYQEICDSFHFFDMFHINSDSNDTDETDCEMWPCDAPYTYCNGRWNRANGCDEINCPGMAKTICANNEHPCIYFNTTIISCLPLININDGHLDCLLGVDEPAMFFQQETSITCNIELLALYRYRYYKLPCWNHSNINIRSQQICNGQNDCPLGDDEWICDWHQYSSCDKIKEFTCKNGTCISRINQWCNGIIDCFPEGEDERFCHMFKTECIPDNSLRREPYISFLYDHFINSNRQLLMSISQVYCHHGINIFNKINNIEECLCPPSYYGIHCELQSERLTIFYRIDVPPTFNRKSLHWLVFYLLDDNNQVLTYETMIHTVFNENLMNKQLIYLNYPRFLQGYSSYNKKFVRIDAYRVTNTSIEPTILSWYYFIQFSAFLPVTRLSILLNLVEPSHNQMLMCQMFGPCQHGTCQIFVNTGTPFCRCHNGWFGNLCEHKRTIDLCQNLNCSRTFSRCVIQNNHAFCLCTLGRMGPKCEVLFDVCSSIYCQNNGTCISIDQKSIPQVCMCSISYFGNLCQHTTAQLQIQIPFNISYIPMMITHFLYTPSTVPGVLLHQDFFFHRNLHSNTQLIIYNYNHINLPPIIITQIFFDSISPYGNYYLLSLTNTNRSKLIITLQEIQHCSNANLYLNATLIHQSWLKRIKFYPLSMKHLQCFYDEAYMCLVDTKGFPHCLIFNHHVTNCTKRNLCEHNGRCLQSKSLGRLEYVCLCPQCTSGDFCQILMNEYSITLDSMLGPIISTNISLHKQSITIKILLIIISLMFIIGFISNICSFLVFRHQDIQQIGCGYYLKILSIINQITIIIFVIRIIYLIYSQIMIIHNMKILNITCYLFDFILQSSISFCDWLHTCIACERTITAMKGTQFNKGLSVRMVKFIIPTLLFQVILTSIHHVFNHILIQDPRSNIRFWCVIKHRQSWLRIYEICISIFNNVIPLCINFICGIVLLISLSIKHRRVSPKKRYRTIFMSNMRLHKDLLIAPLIMIMTKLPLLIISLSVKCLQQQWQIYLSLFAYCLSLMPMISTFFTFVWPSNSYMRKFQEQLSCFKSSK